MRIFNPPNKKGPRFRASRHRFLTDKFFDEFKKKHPEYPNLTRVEFTAIIDTFNEKLWMGVIENRDGVEFPEGLGYVFVGSCKSPNKLNIDFKKSTELGQCVVNRNLSSDGYLAKIFYTNFASKYHYTHRKLWSFKASRKFKLKLSEVYREEWPKYIVVDNFAKVSSFFKHQSRKFKVSKKMEYSKDYNEFDLD
jgi:hypothetical protein